MISKQFQKLEKSQNGRSTPDDDTAIEVKEKVVEPESEGCRIRVLSLKDGDGEAVEDKDGIEELDESFTSNWSPSN